MAAVRAVLIAIMVLVMAVTPLLVPSLGGSSDSLTAYASFAGGARAGERAMAPAQQNGNDNDDDNNDDDDDDGDDNDNNDDDDDDDGDDNDNGDDDDDGDDNDNDGDGNDNVRIVVRTPNDTINKPTKCFDTGEVSVIQLGTGSYDVTVSVMPHASFGQTTRMTLRALDPASVPGPGSAGTLIDSVVFQLDAQSSCDGVAIGTLPNMVNMGIIYNVTNAVDKSKLQIVKLEGGSWTNVDTVPDPNPGNPYVSTTIMSAGTYALIQKP